MNPLLFIILAAVVGAVVWAIITYVPMPAPIRGLIIVAAVLALAVLFLKSLGIDLGHLTFFR